MNNRTEIFESREAFENRPDKKVNGVSIEFAKDNPNYEEQNRTNKGCWNCVDSYFCEYCIECGDSTRCKNCMDCISCSHCYDSIANKFCFLCVECMCCVRCSECEDCDNCYDMSNVSGHINYIG